RQRARAGGPAMSASGLSPIGKPLRRREDPKFLRGAGTYTDDIVLPGQTYAVFVRSPYAHAKIVSIDASEALRSPGVVAVFTGADLATAGVRGLPCGWLIHSRDGTPMKEPVHHVLATSRVRHVGDQVAVVIAESEFEAKDAAEKVHVEYDELAP